MTARYPSEANDINDDDLTAASEFFESLLTQSSPYPQIEKIAVESGYGVPDARQTNRILERFACSGAELTCCVAGVMALQRG